MFDPRGKVAIEKCSIRRLTIHGRSQSLVQSENGGEIRSSSKPFCNLLLTS